MAAGSVTGESWNLGLLNSQTGVTAGIEKTVLNAALLAIDEINDQGGVSGRPLRAVVYDPKSDPKTYRALAERLLTEDRVRILCGCYMSSTRKAVLPVVERYRGLLFYPTLYEGFEYSPHCFYTGAAPNQNSIILADHLLKLGGERFYFIGSNYVFPYESNRIMADYLRQHRAVIVQERYLDLTSESRDFDAVVADIAKYAPDVIFSTVVGAQTALLYRAYRRAGLDPGTLPIASLTTSEAEVAEMGTEAAEGHITAAPFFESLDTPRARAFTERYKAAYGPEAPLTAVAEAAYFQIHVIAEALAVTGSDRFEDLHPAIQGRRFDAPQGEIRIDPENHHTYLWPRVAQLDGGGRFRIVRDSTHAVKPDPYLVSPVVDSWELAATGAQAK